MLDYTFSLIIVVLIGFNIFQLIYWSSQNSKLIDKLMSRNYAEYVQVSKPELPKAENVVDLESAAEEQALLNQLNGMLKP